MESIRWEGVFIFAPPFATGAFNFSMQITLKDSSYCSKVISTIRRGLDTGCAWPLKDIRLPARAQFHENLPIRTTTIQLVAVLLTRPLHSTLADLIDPSTHLPSTSSWYPRSRVPFHIVPNYSTCHHQQPHNMAPTKTHPHPLTNIPQITPTLTTLPHSHHRRTLSIDM